jgi:hypothetical protein
MKLVTTSGFNIKALKLNSLIIQNRRAYCKYQNYTTNISFATPKGIDISWRQPIIVYDTLKNKKFKKFDIVVNTGQRNIITNYNISIQDKMMEHFKPSKHKMVLQYWNVDPSLMPIMPYSEYPGGPIKIKQIFEPYEIITAE